MSAEFDASNNVDQRDIDGVASSLEIREEATETAERDKRGSNKMADRWRGKLLELPLSLVELHANNNIG